MVRDCNLRLSFPCSHSHHPAIWNQPFHGSLKSKSPLPSTSTSAYFIQMPWLTQCRTTVYQRWCRLSRVSVPLSIVVYDSCSLTVSKAGSLSHSPRILSLDGGGIRGLSSLLILRTIMERIKLANQLSQTPKPCEYFDLIGGTSTGGLIAIMLGRLRLVSSFSLCGRLTLSLVSTRMHRPLFQAVWGSV